MTLDIPFLSDIWFLWGNEGKRPTPENHKFIQGILERGEWDNIFFHPDEELVRIVASILSHPVQRTDDFCICARCGKKTRNRVEVLARYVAWCGCP